MQTQQAFTLIETLVALSIIAIIFSFSLLELRFFFENSNDAILQAQLLQSIQVAQHEAQVRRIPVALCNSKNQMTCSGGWRDGQLVFMNERKDGVVSDSGQILAVIHSFLPRGKLHWRAFPYYRDYLLFLPNRQKSTDNGMFWLCHAQNEQPVWAIALAKSGRVRALSPDKNGVIKDAHGKELRCDEG